MLAQQMCVAQRIACASEHREEQGDLALAEFLACFVRPMTDSLWLHW